MKVSGNYIGENTFIEKVEMKMVASSMSTFIVLSNDITDSSITSNISLTINTSFKLIEQQQIYAPLVEQGNNSKSFNDKNISNWFEYGNVILLYDNSSDVNHINWNGASNF